VNDEAGKVSNQFGWRAALLMGSITAAYMYYNGTPVLAMSVLLAGVAYGLVSLVVYGSITLLGLMEPKEVVTTTPQIKIETSNVEGFIPREGGWTRKRDEQGDDSIE
jgi:hypothetical protein